MTSLLDTPALRPTDFQLRKYQDEAIDAVRDEFARGKKSTLIVCATGVGKSVILGMIARRVAERGGRTLVLAHRGELIDQLTETLTRLGLTVGIEKADQYARAYFEPHATVATVQTMQRERLEAWPLDYFKLIVTDEAHHATATTYQNIYKHFNAIHLGVSVGPESVIEMAGGCFGPGFVGSIESAFEKCVSADMEPRDWNEFEVIDFKGVTARGWDGEKFAWKTCHRILRHVGTKPCRKIHSFGSCVLVTDDHSVYRAVPGESIRVQRPNSSSIRKSAKIECVESQEIALRDILVGDDGKGWDGTEERPIDMIEFCSKHMTSSRVSVGCDVRSVDRQVFKDMGISSNTIYDWRTRGAIPLRFYRQMGDIAPEAKHLGIEGSKSRIAPKITMSSWAYVLGFYLGDGWVGNAYKSGRLGFAVENKSADFVQEQIQSLEGVTWDVYRTQRPGASVQLDASNIFVAALILHACGKVACHTKSIPGEWIVSWPRQARLELLAGLIDSDGAVAEGDRGRMRTVVVTTSEKLATSLLSLLRSLGIRGGLHRRSCSGGGVVDGRQISARRQAYSVGWSSHQHNADDAGHKGNRKSLVHGNLSFSEAPVRKIEACESPSYVYDLEMEGHPSFVADGVLVHNTATPDRADEDCLSSVFESVAFEYSMWDAMTAPEPGPYLSRLRFVQCDVGIDLRDIRTTAGDLNAADLEEAIRPHIETLANAIKQEVGTRKTLIFTPDVGSSMAMASALNSIGVAARWVAGDSKDRKEIIDGFRLGDFQVLSNCNLASEGFDVGDIEAIALCRPTKSRALYAQQVGRGTRLSLGKECCLLIDFNWLTEKHKLVKPVELFDTTHTDSETLEIATEMLKKEKGLDLKDVIESAEEEKRKRTILRVQARERQVKYRKVSYDPLAAMESLGLPIRKEATNLQGTITQRQREVLEKFGVTGMESCSKRRATALIDTLMERSRLKLASHKQVAHLLKNGVPPEEARAMTKAAASEFLGNLWGDRDKPSPRPATPSPILDHTKPYQPTPAPSADDEVTTWVA